MSRKKSLTDKIVCENIKKLRKNIGLNGIIFAKKIGISQSYLSELENCIAKPNKTLLLAISYIYNTSMEWLLTGEGEMTRQGAECDASIYKVGMAEEDQETVELVGMVKKVLKSGTDRADTLAVNIRSSHQGMIKESEMEYRLAALEQVAHPPNKASKIIREGNNDAQRGEILKKRKA